MPNGQMWKQLRKMADAKEITTDGALKLSLSAQADILESNDEIKEEYGKLNEKVNGVTDQITGINGKIDDINVGLGKYHRITEKLQTSSLVKVSRFIDNHNRVALFIGIILTILIIPELRHALFAWISDPDNILGLLD